LDANSKPTGQFGELREIINFAIEREQEAVDFYTDVAARMKPETLAEELRRIAAMEVQHRERLKRLDVTAYAAAPVAKASDLKIADYLVALEPKPGMTWQEILNIAMHRELASMNLYADLAKLSTDAGVRRLFENLSAEESKHKLFFETTWDDEVLIEN
jgi:rubrerythrin